MLKWISRQPSYVVIDRRGVKWRAPMDYNGCQQISDIVQSRRHRMTRSPFRIEGLGALAVAGFRGVLGAIRVDR